MRNTVTKRSFILERRNVRTKYDVYTLIASFPLPHKAGELEITSHLRLATQLARCCIRSKYCDSVVVSYNATEHKVNVFRKEIKA